MRLTSIREAARDFAGDAAEGPADICLDLTPLLQAEATVAAAEMHHGGQRPIGWQDLDGHVRRHILALLPARQQAAVMPVARAWRDDVAALFGGHSHTSTDATLTACMLFERQRLVAAAHASRLDYSAFLLLIVTGLGALAGVSGVLLLFNVVAIDYFGQRVAGLKPALIFGGGAAAGVVVLLTGWLRWSQNPAHVQLRRFEQVYSFLAARPSCARRQLAARLCAQHFAETKPGVLEALTARDR